MTGSTVPRAIRFSTAQVTLELRWFFAGRVPDEVTRWFDTGLPGADVVPAARSDLYLIVPGRDDIGLKLRERKLELKVRSRAAPFRRPSGVSELWTKWTWSYARPAEVDAGFAESARGARLDVGKVRRQRKYVISSRFAFHPVPVEQPARRAALIEVTELLVRRRRAWTLGFDAIGSTPERDAILAHAVEALLARFPRGVRLSRDRSFGYPQWLMSTIRA